MENQKFKSVTEKLRAKKEKEEQNNEKTTATVTVHTGGKLNPKTLSISLQNLQ
jgi:biopolymer transport protein ExbD